MQTTKRTSPHFMRRKLQKHTPANIESVGRTDIDTFADVADAPGGKGTVLRLILGASENLPVRAITFADSALRCVQVMPVEQVQIVHAKHLGSEVNGLDAGVVQEEALAFAGLLALHTRAHFPELEGKVLHATDTPEDLGRFKELADMALAMHPSLAQQLGKQGTKHGGNHITYLAAHGLFQDTDQLRLDALLPDAPEQASAERIVSIGHQGERVFYEGRMAMRGIAAGLDLLPSAQIFTRHVSPPYFVARGGEMLLRDALQTGFDRTQVTDFAAQRDIDHFMRTIDMGGES